MSSFSEYNKETGEYDEGRIGEACCPNCGFPMLAKFTDNGDLIELIGSCPICNGGEVA